jgi:hypothetical protein
MEALRRRVDELERLVAGLAGERTGPAVKKAAARKPAAGGARARTRPASAPPDDGQ